MCLQANKKILIKTLHFTRHEGRTINKTCKWACLSILMFLRWACLSWHIFHFIIHVWVDVKPLISSSWSYFVFENHLPTNSQTRQILKNRNTSGIWVPDMCLLFKLSCAYFNYVIFKVFGLASFFIKFFMEIVLSYALFWRTKHKLWGTWSPK